ncbi:MAG: EF-P beta-lysylation protein EpmB [Gammaproteobacteria bacterium]
MIPRITATRQVPAWQVELSRAISDPAALLQQLDLGPEWLPGARAAAALFPLRVPRGFVGRMRRGDPHDPLLAQVLPLHRELAATPGFGSDPVGDLHAMKVPGVLHKYHGRVLLVTTGACAVHCRYCFRRHFPYGEANPAGGHWSRALEHIAADASIEEVILSGGDPLLLSDGKLAALASALEAIPHVRRLRVHSRLPVVLPERVDESLLGWLADRRLRTVVVIHANHPQEIDASVAAVCRRMAAAGIDLLNQSVLLKDVNDSPETLIALSERLFEARVLPYYLHLLDRVAGAAHFSVDADRAQELAGRLQARLPGYLVPRLVRELPGAPAKTAVAAVFSPF